MLAHACTVQMPPPHGILRSISIRHMLLASHTAASSPAASGLAHQQRRLQAGPQPRPPCTSQAPTCACRCTTPTAGCTPSRTHSLSPLLWAASSAAEASRGSSAAALSTCLALAARSVPSSCLPGRPALQGSGRLQRGAGPLLPCTWAVQGWGGWGTVPALAGSGSSSWCAVPAGPCQPADQAATCW